jgi:hypothetical protein
MRAKLILAFTALATLTLPIASAQAGVGIAVGIGVPAPYCYRPRYRVYVAPPPVYVAPRVYVAPAPSMWRRRRPSYTFRPPWQSSQRRCPSHRWHLVHIRSHCARNVIQPGPCQRALRVAAAVRFLTSAAIHNSSQRGASCTAVGTFDVSFTPFFF